MGRGLMVRVWLWIQPLCFLVSRDVNKLSYMSAAIPSPQRTQLFETVSTNPSFLKLSLSGLVVTGMQSNQLSQHGSKRET